MGGGPDINYPQQPTYGEGMADAMKAQMEQLLGQGEYAQLYSDAGFEGGNLGDIITGVEAPIRQQAAQVDTDVFRRTLLGTEQEATTGTYDEEGRLVVGFSDPTTGEPEKGKYSVRGTRVSKKMGPSAKASSPFYKLELVDRSTGEVVAQDEMSITTSSKNPDRINYGELDYSSFEDFISKSEFDRMVTGAQNNNLQTMDFMGKGQTTEGGGEPQPIYGKDPNGNIIVDKTKIGETETIPASFAGDGMINLLGDKRNLTEFVNRAATQADVDAGLADEVGQSITVGQDTGRRAGFDKDDQFLGLAAFTEDIQRANLQRQREADLADVERLAGRYSTLMEDFKPASVSGLKGAKDLLEEQRENLTGMREATQADVNANRATEVGEMIQTRGGGPIDLPSTLTPADYAMTGDASVGQLQSGEDTLRSALLADARGALNEGLTDREMKQVEEAARARQTLMGRTFDQSGAIAEAEARIKEDNQRKMQNRAFTQSALGQEAGIQTGDVSRAMTADQFNIGAKMDAQRLNEQLRQQGLANYVSAVGNLSQIERQSGLDPFQALLGRGGGTALQQGQQVFGQANYGLQSGPQMLNPEAGLGYISNAAANQANMYAAQVGADAARSAGLMGMGGSIIGGMATGGTGFFCWVAREVYGPTNPAWLQFRDWVLNESPQWFFDLYAKYGERFASWISDKPRLKTIIRKWMDSKIGDR